MKNYITFVEDFKDENGVLLLEGGVQHFILDEDTDNYFIQTSENSNKTVAINKNDTSLSYKLS